MMTADRAAPSIVAEGVFDLPMAAYLADPCPVASFSASIGKTLMQLSPKHAWMEHPRLGGTPASALSTKADFGSVVHELVLGRGAQYCVVDVPNFLTKAAKALRDEIIADGGVPIKTADLERAEAAADAIRKQIPDVWAEGAAEQTLIWRDGPAWCRARPDWMVRSADMVFDLKITGVNMSQRENALHRHIFACWFDMTVAHYADGYRTLFGQELEYRFLFVEDHAPFSIRPFKLSGQGLEMGERKLRVARAWWKSCMAKNRWPGMDLQLEIADPEPWHAAGWLTYDEGPSELESELALEMQAPLEVAE